MSKEIGEISPKLSRFSLPGFGLPVNFIPHAAHRSFVAGIGRVNHEPTGEGRDLFRSALNYKDMTGGYVSLPLTSIREFTMLALMNQLSDKPSWETKLRRVFDEDIVAKWKIEALAALDKDISDKMFNWCIAELRYKAEIFREKGAISVYNGDVVKSDTAVSHSLKEALRAAVAPLEEVPAWEMDWHPGSDETVLDLVHPSLFPLVYGRSHILPDNLTTLEDCVERCGDGVVIPIPEDKDVNVEVERFANVPTKSPFSAKYQWLPCEVDFSGEGDHNARITSYINNLHPRHHKDLYAVIEKIIALAIPLWNMSLTPLKTPYYRYKRIVYERCTYNIAPEDEGGEEGPEQADDEEWEDFVERRTTWRLARIIQPEPEEFAPPTVGPYMAREYMEGGKLKPEKTVDLRREYRTRGLQVIVKLANIQLTPEKPKYSGGSWHVEGQLNEHICASALYYYDSANITTSRLAFRQSTNVDDAGEVRYPQNQHEWLKAVFGCEQDGPAVQEVGTVDTREGRLVTFPNILQHQVQPFELADPTKPGHRKLLALFLVDPNIRVISTANVPCQQRAWWADAVQRGEGRVGKLPTELREAVFNGVEGFPIGLEEAKEMRLELMEERREFVVEHLESYELNTFSLCEH